MLFRSMYSEGEGSRLILVCDVLIGNCKVYKSLASDQSLMREPISNPGEPCWTSIQGNITGQEIGIYNNTQVNICYVVECFSKPETWELTLLDVWANRYRISHPGVEITADMLKFILEKIRTNPCLKSYAVAIASAEIGRAHV